LPADVDGGRVDTVDTSTADGPARTQTLTGHVIELEPFAVAVVTLR
jgi:hypothetical protein